MCTLFRSVRLVGAYVGKDGAVIDGVVLEDDVSDQDLGVLAASAEVEHELGVGGIDAFQAGKVEDIVLEGKDLDSLCEQEVAVVGVVCELDSDALETCGGIDDAGEVIAHRG